MIWTPHATVATIVEHDNSFLMVEELSEGHRVFNQPAGHVDADESIFAAAVRETMEETGWQVRLEKFVGTYIYQAPSNGVTYYRFCFSAVGERQVSTTLDEGILAAHWLSLEEIHHKGDALRSPLVLRCLHDYKHRPLLPLDYIYEHGFSKPNTG